jgi:hypothetical protein
MAVYESLLLNTAVPQIQAAQAGDSYVMVVNATTPALRITQTGTGDAILVEDAANPDSSPFVVTATGSVGIGLSSPEGKLHVANTGTAGTTADNLAVYFTSTNRNANLYIRAKNTEGSVLNFADGDSDVVGRIAYEHSDNSMRFDVSGGEKMRLDASGNLGLGVAPETWSTGSSIEVGSYFLKLSGSGTYGAVVLNNAYYNSGWKFAEANWANMYQTTAGIHSWHTSTSAGGAADAPITFIQAMTLDASGNWLLGKTSAGATGGVEIIPNVSSLGFGRLYLNSGYGAVANSIVFAYAGTHVGIIQQGTASTSYFTNGSAGSGLVGVDANTLGFNTGGTERARITSGGDLLVGTTVTGLTGGGVRLKNGGGNLGEIALSNNSGSADYVARFLWGSSATLVGNITVSSTATAYNTSSDYRLKDNPQPLTNSGAFIDALKPKTWDWKSDGSKGVGFIAHEVQEVSPKTVHGVKDAVDEDGNPVYQAMEYGSAEFIANIVAELQSLRARVAQLEAK